MSVTAKILSTVLMAVLVIGLTLVTIFGNKEKGKEEIKSVSIKNNSLYQEVDYLKYAWLDKSALLQNVTLPIIKDRIEKHPYVQKAEVKFADAKNIVVYVEEKKIKALLQKDGEAFFITDRFEVLPVFANTNLFEIPLIMNSRDLQNLKIKETYCSSDIKEAFRIIDGVKYLNFDLYKSLNLINLRSGGDILLGFNCFKAPVIFGKGDEARKLVYLESLYKNFNNQLSDSINYIDLRYSKFIYMGKMNG